METLLLVLGPLCDAELSVKQPYGMHWHLKNGMFASNVFNTDPSSSTCVDPACETNGDCNAFRTDL